ncbi:MAG TPA: hypothetical protein VG245_10285 [Candidatus Dormibacteraeota bacterium]|nr:hypothetical protein [Candidatus Dormibacteraeota bacterium]
MALAFDPAARAAYVTWLGPALRTWGPATGVALGLATVAMGAWMALTRSQLPGILGHPLLPGDRELLATFSPERFRATGICITLQGLGLVVAGALGFDVTGLVILVALQLAAFIGYLRLAARYGRPPRMKRRMAVVVPFMLLMYAAAFGVVMLAGPGLIGHGAASDAPSVPASLTISGGLTGRIQRAVARQPMCGLQPGGALRAEMLNADLGASLYIQVSGYHGLDVYSLGDPRHDGTVSAYALLVGSGNGSWETSGGSVIVTDAAPDSASGTIVADLLDFTRGAAGGPPVHVSGGWRCHR